MMYYIVSVLFLLLCTCIAVNIMSVSYNSGLISDILLLTQAPIFVSFGGNIKLLLHS